MSSLPRLLRSCINIGILFCALVLTPLFALSHFSAGLAGLVGGFAANYLHRPSLLSSEQARRARAETKLHQQRTAQAKERAGKRRAAAAGSKQVGTRGKRVLLRGAGALAVGWVPVLGVAADVASLGADYADLCALFATIDELSTALYLPEANLYGDNYCDRPELGIELLKESAQTTRFPWDNSVLPFQSAPPDQGAP